MLAVEWGSASAFAMLSLIPPTVIAIAFIVILVILIGPRPPRLLRKVICGMQARDAVGSSFGSGLSPPPPMPACSCGS